MRVIPVLDIRHGQAVQAIAGDRAHYGPIRSVLHDSTDPIALARAGCDAWNLPDLYLADLDAILGEAAPDVDMYRTLADLGLTLWVDAGVREASDVPRLVEARIERVIVGLETVRGPEALAEIVAEFGPEPVVFSLDLREGRPMVETRQTWGTDRPEAIASKVADLGVFRMILLDLASVGTGKASGLIPGLPKQSVEWYVGGGISSPGDLKTLRSQGVVGVLIGTALHDGRIKDLRIDEM
jgi:HisA/HisF family protein